jgi:hypothetical protein
MSRECSTHGEGEGEENLYNDLVGKPGGRRTLGRLRLGWKIILRWILDKYNGLVWTGFI